MGQRDPPRTGWTGRRRSAWRSVRPGRRGTGSRAAWSAPASAPAARQLARASRTGTGRGRPAAPPGWTAPSPARPAPSAASACPACSCRSGSPRARSLPRAPGAGRRAAGGRVRRPPAPRGSWTAPTGRSTGAPAAPPGPRAGRTGQADRVRVDGVQVGQRVDQDVGDGAPLPGRLRPAGRQGAADNVPVDLLHHVEGHADQVTGVLKQDGRHRHGGARQRPLHPGLPAHVVRPRQQRPVRRPAQHRLARVTAQNERQVRLAAGDKGGLQPFPAGVAQRPRERGPTRSSRVRFSYIAPFLQVPFRRP